jgi:hypothetical protein
VIAVPAPILRIGGIEISGISSDSPLFQAMEGLRAGNEFEWNGQIVAVKEVY